MTDKAPTRADSLKFALAFALRNVRLAGHRPGLSEETRDRVADEAVNQLLRDGRWAELNEVGEPRPLSDGTNDKRKRPSATRVKKAEIEDLAFGFRNEMKAEISKHLDSKAVGAVGSFIADIEAHRARYAKTLDAIRAGADAATVALADEIGREIDALATKEIKRVRGAGRVEFDLEADHQIPLGIHKIGLSDNQLEVIMRAAEPLPEENCQEFLHKVAADLQVRGQINDDDVAAAVQLALGALIHNSAAWKKWNQNSLPTRQDGQGFDTATAVASSLLKSA
jgi:hypothetical protein